MVRIAVMGREKESRMAKSQSKAGVGIAYGQRKVSEDGEKSVQSWNGDSLWAEKREHECREISPKLEWG